MVLSQKRISIHIFITWSPSTPPHANHPPQRIKTVELRRHRSKRMQHVCNKTSKKIRRMITLKNLKTVPYPSSNSSSALIDKVNSTLSARTYFLSHLRSSGLLAGQGKELTPYSFWKTRTTKSWSRRCRICNQGIIILMMSKPQPQLGWNIKNSVTWRSKRSLSKWLRTTRRSLLD